VFFRLRLRLSLQNTAALPTPILSLNLVQRLGGVTLTISTPEDLIQWLAVVGLWDLALMFSLEVFSLLGYLTGEQWGRTRLGAVVDAEPPPCRLTKLARRKRRGILIKFHDADGAARYSCDCSLEMVGFVHRVLR